MKQVDTIPAQMPTRRIPIEDVNEQRRLHDGRVAPAERICGPSSLRSTRAERDAAVQSY